MALIDAFRKDTGERVLIPAHWVTHPSLGAPFTTTPRQKAVDTRKAAPAATPKAPAAGDTEKE